MEKLKKIEEVVERILDKRIDARESDDILYVYVCEYFHRGISTTSFKDFFFTRSQIGCPNFASVTRARRKIFEKRPELKPEKVTKGREEVELVYKDYAMS